MFQNHMCTLLKFLLAPSLLSSRLLPTSISSRSAGVRVMMITGDSKDTAVAIAKEIGIFQSSSEEADEVAGNTKGKTT